MGNRTRNPVEATADPQPILVWGHFTTNGSSAVSTSTIKGCLATVTRTAIGTYSLTFQEAFPKLLAVGDCIVVGSNGRKAYVTAVDVTAKTATIQIRGAGAVPAWSAALTVTSHVVTLAAAGRVVAVDAVTASATGPKSQIYTGTPGDGQVQVTYSAGGIATLTFDTSDAVTAARILVDDGGTIQESTSEVVYVSALVSGSSLAKTPR